MKHFVTLIAAAMTFMVSGWSQTVVDIVVDSEDHTVLEAAVVEAGLVESLVKDCQRFLSSGAWYRQRGIPHRYFPSIQTKIRSCTLYFLN